MQTLACVFRSVGMSAFAAILFASAGCVQPPTTTSGPTKVSIPSLEPATVIVNPGGRYSDNERNFNMSPSADITRGGRIWVTWISGGDDDSGYLVAATSEDKGRSWSKPALAIDPHRYKEEANGAFRRSTVVPATWVAPDGALWIFYQQSLGFFDGRAGVWAITTRNPDAARPAWTPPVRLFHGAMLNKPLVLKNGDWLAFSSLWTRDRIAPDHFRDAFRDLDVERGVNVYRSSDLGRSWRKLAVVQVPEAEFDEPSCVQLVNGDLWLLTRTKYGLAETISKDGGATWLTPKKSSINHTNSRIFLKRLHSGRLLLVKHGGIEETLGRYERRDLMAFVSADDGNTWSEGLLLDGRRNFEVLGHKQQTSGVSYPDGFEEKDGYIYIVYDYNRGGDAEILLSRFKEVDALSGRLIDPGSFTQRIVNKARGKK